MIFEDRQDAGKKLAEKIGLLPLKNPIVFGLPRGGVVVAKEVAKKLNSSLDVVISRKIGAPRQPELAIGAVAEGEVLVLDNTIIKRLGVSKSELKFMVEKEKEEVKKRIQLFREGKLLKNLRGKTVLIVDDGLATGMTALAAIKTVKKLHPFKIIFATPICALSPVEEVAREVERVICLEKSDTFMAIGQWYEDFNQVSDEEVLSLLKI